MAELTANGLRFHVQVIKRSGRPDAPQVVMLHGLVIDRLSSYFCTIATRLAQEADVHLYDMRGHGSSDVPPSGYTVADHVSDLAALLDEWGVDEPVHLFGNSFGSAVALAFAHEHPDRVASLFLIEAHPVSEGWGRRMADFIDQTLADAESPEGVEWMEENGTRSLRNWSERCKQVLRTTTLVDDMRLEPDFPQAWLAELRCPVFAIYGSESDVLARAEELERHVEGCELEIVPGYSHFLLVEASGVVRDHAVAWLRRHAPAAETAAGIPA